MTILASDRLQSKDRDRYYIIIKEPIHKDKEVDNKLQNLVGKKKNSQT